MDQASTIELFEACQDKKAKALQAGDSEEEAQAAAAAHWNEWADPLITDRTWETEEDWDQARGPHTVGKNDVTREILEEACVDFSSLSFRLHNRNSAPKGEGGEVSPSSSGTVKEIVCEGLIISFHGFHFPGNADFRSAKFERNADFRSAIFKGEADFRSAKFERNAYFQSATFEGTADFWSATFEGNAHFRSVTFKGTASFQYTKFESNAYFEKATFEGTADFKSAIFERTVSFSKAKLYGSALFTAIHSERAFSLADCKFFRFVPDFIQAHFTAPPRLDHMKFPSVRFCSKALIPLSGADIKKNKKDDENEVTENDIARYYTLRRIAIEGKDQTTERVAFKAEMRARRGMYKWKDTPTRVVSYLYDLISDFGSSFVRPALFWTAQLILVAIIYQCMATEDVQCPYCSAAIISHVSRDALQLSAAQTLPFLITSQHLDFTKAYRRLYGVEQSELLSSFGIVSTLHALFSVLWLFLILLALRNLFKIR